MYRIWLHRVVSDKYNARRRWLNILLLELRWDPGWLSSERSAEHIELVGRLLDCRPNEGGAIMCQAYQRRRRAGPLPRQNVRRCRGPDFPEESPSRWHRDRHESKQRDEGYDE